MTLRKIALSLIVFCLFSIPSPALDAGLSQAVESWRDLKFGMFIHWGLYSVAGGVWNGEKVETGYGNLEGKVGEKIRHLSRVVSLGGVFLLNIGPRGDGSIVEFEADVLRGVGKWMKVHEAAEGNLLFPGSPETGK